MEMESQFWSRISNEVNKISHMEEFNLMKFVANKYKLIGGECVRIFQQGLDCFQTSTPHEHHNNTRLPLRHQQPHLHN